MTGENLDPFDPDEPQIEIRDNWKMENQMVNHSLAKGLGECFRKNPNFKSCARISEGFICKAEETPVALMSFVGFIGYPWFTRPKVL